MGKSKSLIFLVLAVLTVSLVSTAPIDKRQDDGPQTTLEVPAATTTQQQKKKSIETEKDATDYLKKFGYFDDFSKSKNSALTSDDFTEALKRIQKFAGLKVTGKLDDATKTLMGRDRCHLPDTITPTNDNNTRAKRYVLLGRWGSKSLTYNIFNTPSRTNSLNLEESLKTAVGLWTAVANIDITKTSSSNPNIKMAFYSGDHGDGYPFDGTSGVLAHAFFPEDGKLHFDNAEIWSGTYGTNLMQVATHEMGHILGLAHSTVQNAVMYPYYSYNPNYALQTDDINGIVALYGRRQSTGNNPSTFTTTSTGRPATTTSTVFVPRTVTTTKTSTAFAPGTVTTTTFRPTTTTQRRIPTTRRKKNWWWAWGWGWAGLGSK